MRVLPPVSVTTAKASGRLPHQPLLDFHHVVRAELDVGGAGNAAYLLGAADADDRTSDRWIPQGPRDGHFAGRRVVALADRAQRLDQPQIAGEQRFLKVRAAFPPIVFGE